MAVQAGAHCLEMNQGGRGTLLSGVPGVPVGRVLVLGGGVVGTNAARMAMGLEASVTVIDISLSRLYDLDLQFGPTLNTIYSTRDAIEEHVISADLVVGAVLVPGAAAPRLVTGEMVQKMKRGSVIVDVAIDQGGCIETSRPTTHADPTYVEHGVVHYCVTNMPGAVARTSTFALNNATLPFIVSLADNGLKDAMQNDAHLLNGPQHLPGSCDLRSSRARYRRRIRCTAGSVGGLKRENDLSSANRIIGRILGHGDTAPLRRWQTRGRHE